MNSPKILPKRTIVIECRCCGNTGYYEDIRDDYAADKPDFEYGTCGECDPGPTIIYKISTDGYCED